MKKLQGKGHKITPEIQKAVIIQLSKQLDVYEYDILASYYSKLKEAQRLKVNLNNNIEKDLEIARKLRVNIATRIKQSASRLLRYVKEGRALWSKIPEEVRDMFEKETITKDGKTYERLQLKPEVYSVGRGRKKGAKDILKKVDFTKDTSKILENADLLKRVTHDAYRFVFSTGEISSKLEKIIR